MDVKTYLAHWYTLLLAQRATLENDILLPFLKSDTVASMADLARRFRLSSVPAANIFGDDDDDEEDNYSARLARMWKQSETRELSQYMFRVCMPRFRLLAPGVQRNLIVHLERHYRTLTEITYYLECWRDALAADKDEQLAPDFLHPDSPQLFCSELLRVICDRTKRMLQIALAQQREDERPNEEQAAANESLMRTLLLSLHCKTVQHAAAARSLVIPGKKLRGDRVSIRLFPPEEPEQDLPPDNAQRVALETTQMEGYARVAALWEDSVQIHRSYLSCSAH